VEESSKVCSPVAAEHYSAMQVVNIAKKDCHIEDTHSVAKGVRSG